MEKYPVMMEGRAVGELTVRPEALYTGFTVDCRLQEGLWCAWAVGERGRLRIGIPEPENGALRIHRRFSRALTEPLGALLRGELRRPGEERERWEPMGPPAERFRSPYLRRCLAGREGALFCREGQRALAALPRDDRRPFPLEGMFCFARLRRIREREYWVFAFDSREWPVI